MRIPLSLAVILLSYLVGISSCEKCSCCAPVAGGITCIKGADTIQRNFGGESVFIVHDTLNFYTNLGYTCSDMTGPLTYDVPQTCGALRIKQQQQMGSECIVDLTFADGHCK